MFVIQYHIINVH